jgi:nucleotide-binding universal stress UspA family protein
MQHIVVGIDGSPQSWRALEVAREAASGTGAAITAIHADHLPSRAAWGLGESLDDVVLEEDEIRQVVTDRLREMNADGGPEVGFEIIKAKPVDALLKAAGDLGADLIVVGHNGHGDERRQLGSVAHDVVGKAEVSVLVTR